MTKKELGKKILALLDSPNDWAFTTFTANHKPSGIEVRTANDWMFVSLWKPQAEGCFRFRDRFRIYYGLRKIQRQRASNRIAEAMNKLDSRLSIVPPIIDHASEYKSGQWMVN
jgi:hypothetical protein